MTTNSCNIKAIHIGNSLAAPAVSMDIIRSFVLTLAPIIESINGVVWLPLACNCSFANSTRSIVMYKKIWKNPSCGDLIKFHNHTPETIIFEDSSQVSFMTIIQIQKEELLSAYEMVGTYNKNKFIMITPSSIEILDYIGLISELFRGHQRNGLIDIRSLLVDILNTFDNIIVSSTWGSADDWNSGIGFYANKNNSSFNKLSNSIMHEFMTCKNVIIETEPNLYL